ncbi:hypothetical protein ES703_85010 [subsurface metagenome]
MNSESAWRKNNTYMNITERKAGLTLLGKIQPAVFDFNDKVGCVQCQRRQQMGQCFFNIRIRRRFHSLN